MAEESVGAAAALRLIVKDLEKSLVKNADNLVAKKALQRLDKKVRILLKLAEKGRFQEMLAHK